MTICIIIVIEPPPIMTRQSTGHLGGRCFFCLSDWWPLQDSNLRPSGYEPDALTAGRRSHISPAEVQFHRRNVRSFPAVTSSRVMVLGRSISAGARTMQKASGVSHTSAGDFVAAGGN